MNDDVFGRLRPQQMVFYRCGVQADNGGGVKPKRARLAGEVEHPGHVAVNVADGRGGAVQHLHRAEKVLGTQHHAGLARVRGQAQRIGAYAFFAQVAAHPARQGQHHFGWVVVGIGVVHNHAMRVGQYQGAGGARQGTGQLLQLEVGGFQQDAAAREGRMRTAGRDHGKADGFVGLALRLHTA